MTSSGIPLLSLRNISKVYEDERSTMVLQGVDLDIYPEEYAIFYGPSGSGKSTLLNIIAGLDSPTTGQIYVNGESLNQYDNAALSGYHRLKMGMVFQQFNLIKSLNVWENVALPQTAGGVRYRLRRARALYLLKIFGIDAFADRHVNELSGGQQQRVAIARALVNNPYLLIVDEPTGNLDSKSAGEVMDIFDNLHQKAQHTIILVTHNPEYLKYASRVIHFRDGRVTAVDKQDLVPMDNSTAPQYEALAEYKKSRTHLKNKLE